MGEVHNLFPSFYREPAKGIRNRFPPPWFVEAFDGGYRVVDSMDVRLITIRTSPNDPPSRDVPFIVPQLSSHHALILALGIVRMGNQG